MGFLDGPFLLPPGEGCLANGQGRAFTWIDPAEAGEMRRGASACYSGLESSLQRVLSADCDGVVAFSLGAAVLVALLCHPEHGTALRTRLRFVGLFSGFVPEDPQVQAWVEQAGVISDLPSFHCIGRADEEISADRSDDIA